MFNGLNINLHELSGSKDCVQNRQNLVLYTMPINLSQRGELKIGRCVRGVSWSTGMIIFNLFITAVRCKRCCCVDWKAEISKAVDMYMFLFDDILLLTRVKKSSRKVRSTVKWYSTKLYNTNTKQILMLRLVQAKKLDTFTNSAHLAAASMENIKQGQESMRPGSKRGYGVTHCQELSSTVSCSKFMTYFFFLSPQ